jgi:hypothetical protein
VPLRLRTALLATVVLSAIAYVIGGLLLIVATHWGHFG